MFEADIESTIREPASKLKQERKITREVKKFYEKIQFPGRRPIEQDSLIFLRKFSKLIDAQQKDPKKVRVLDAGCGTGNTSIKLAGMFQNVEFEGIDLSSTSIATAKRSAQNDQLSNLSFHEWDLLERLPDQNKFNIILCFGVLHHTAQMRKVLRNLQAALLPEGTLFLWVYGLYGRYFHSLNVELLSMLINASDDKSDPIDLAREFISSTQDGHVLIDLLGSRSEDPMLRSFYNDATWIADQFLNPNEFMVSMKDLIEMTGDTGFDISEWIGAPKDISGHIQSQTLRERFNKLSRKDRYIAMDLLLKMDRYFLVLKKK